MSSANETNPNCGACPGDGSVCEGACRVEGESPAVAERVKCTCAAKDMPFGRCCKMTAVSDPSCRAAFEQWFGLPVEPDADIQTTVAWDHWQAAWSAAKAAQPVAQPPNAQQVVQTGVPDTRSLELDFLEHWLRTASEPIGQQCCGNGVTECCGCPEPVYLSPNEVFEAMNKRHRELTESLAAAPTPEVTT